MVTYEDDAALRSHIDAWTGISFRDFANKGKVRDSWVESPITDGSPLGPPRFLIHPIKKVPIPFRDACPYERRIDRKEYYERTKGIPTARPEWFIGHRTRWQFLWPSSVHKRFEANGWLLSDEECESEWLEDHPLLSVKGEFFHARATRFNPIHSGAFVPPSQPFPLSTGGLRLPVGYGDTERVKKPSFSPRGLGHFNPRKLRRLMALIEQDRSGGFERKEGCSLDPSDPHYPAVKLCQETLSSVRARRGL